MIVCAVRTGSRWAWRRRPPRFAHTFGKNLHILSLSLCMPGVLASSPPCSNPWRLSPCLPTTVVLRATFCLPQTRSPSAAARHSLSAPTFLVCLPLLRLCFSESKIDDICGVARWMDSRLAPPLSVHDTASPADRSRHCRLSRRCNRQSFHWRQRCKSPWYHKRSSK